MKKLLRPILLSAAFVLVLASCGAGNDFVYGPVSPSADAPMVSTPEMMVTADSAEVHFAPQMAGGQAQGIAISAPAAPRMMIRNADVEMSAATANFAHVAEILRRMPEIYGGFVEQSSAFLREGFIHGIWQHQRHFTITLRVPSANFAAALESIRDVGGNVHHISQSAQDVTGQYYDMAGRLETRLIEEARVLELIEDTPRINIRDLLILEERLGQIRTQIEIYRSRMSDLGSRAAYSTITVSLREEVYGEYEEEEDTFFVRVADAFGSSAGGTADVLQAIAVFLAGAVLPLATAAVLGIGTWKIVAAIYANNRKKRA